MNEAMQKLLTDFGFELKYGEWVKEDPNSYTKFVARVVENSRSYDVVLIATYYEDGDFENADWSDAMDLSSYVLTFLNTEEELA